MARKLITILVVIMPVILMITGCAAEGTQVGNPAHDFQLQDLDGQAISLSDLWGKPVLINFWASWCRPCVFEMPYMQQVYDEWTGQGLVLLAINIGESFSTVENFMQNHNLSMPVLLDSKRVVAQKYNVTAIPTTFFVDKGGIIKGKVVGAFPNAGEIEKHLGKIIQ